MGDLKAFKLAAGRESDFSGGTTSYGGEGRMFDVGAALTNPDTGEPTETIVTDNVALINALVDYPLLEEVAAPEGAEPITQESEGAPTEPGNLAADVPAEHADEADAGQPTEEFGNE